MGVISNQFQGEYKKVLMVCSAGILRSATAAHILAGSPWNLNTRNAGTASYALIPVTEELLQWADEVVCMETEHAIHVRNKYMDYQLPVKRIITLGIEDIYEYRHPTLIKLIKEKYDASQELDPIIESPGPSPAW
jgi:predicted protein tyrosine phosphatase